MTRAGEGPVPESILRRAKQSWHAPDGDCFFDETATDEVSEPFPQCSVDKIGINDNSAPGNTASQFAAREPGGWKDNMAVVAVLFAQLLRSQLVISTTTRGRYANRNDRDRTGNSWLS